MIMHLPADTLTCKVTPDSVDADSLSCSMPPLQWVDLWTTIGSVATAAATVALVIAAIWAGRIAVSTLRQMKADSIAQTRPYVYAQLVPGLAGIATWDLVIRNTGKSTARDIAIACSQWPVRRDIITDSIHTLFGTAQTIPPGASIRAFWRGDPRSEGQTPTGMDSGATLSISYKGDDSSQPIYREEFHVSSTTIGLTPAPSDAMVLRGGMTPGEEAIHSTLKKISFGVGELRR